MSIADAFVWLENNYTTRTVRVPKIKQKKKRVPSTSAKTILYWHNLLLLKHRDRFFKEERGLDVKQIKQFALGWDGERYILPVWKDEPVYSEVVTYIKRAATKNDTPKYLLKPGQPVKYLWGQYHIKQSKIAFLFAGILDAILAYQDGYPAVSTITGTKINNNNWPTELLPNTRYLVICFDRKETQYAAKISYEWEKAKGRKTSTIIHWPYIDPKLDDYSDYRLHYGIDFIEEQFTNQIPINNIR
jgi:hypothetical protein